MRISDWSADVCSSDLRVLGIGALAAPAELDDDHLAILRYMRRQRLEIAGVAREPGHAQDRRRILAAFGPGIDARVQPDAVVRPPILVRPVAAAFLLGQYGTSPCFVSCVPCTGLVRVYRPPRRAAQAIRRRAGCPCPLSPIRRGRP